MKKQTLNWFHLAGSLATERNIKMNLLSKCYLPKRVKPEKHLWGMPLHVSEPRLWPTGYVLNSQHVKFLRMKAETQFQIISRKDAQLVLDYLPIITCAIRDDPKLRNKRLAFVNGINAIHEATNTNSANSTAIMPAASLSDK